MDFPSQLPNNMDPSVSGAQTFLQTGIEYQGRQLLQGTTFPNLGTIPTQRTGFEPTRFQFQYQQPMTMAAGFPAGAFNQLVAQKNPNSVPTFYNQQFVQQQASLPGVLQEQMPNFSQPNQAIAMGMQAMNVQMVKDSQTVNQNLLCGIPSVQNKMAVAAAQSLHSMVVSPTAQPVLYAGNQTLSQMHTGLQEFLQRNQITQVPNQQTAMQYNQANAINAECFEQQTKENVDSQNGQALTTTVAHPSMCSQLPLVNTLADVNSETWVHKQCVSSTDTGPEANVAQQEMEISNPSVTDMGTENQDVNGSVTQNAIQMIKPTLKHTIKKHSPKETKQKSVLKPKSVLETSIHRTSLTPFFCLGRFGDRSPWKHHEECDITNFLEGIDSEEEESYEENQEIKSEPEEDVEYQKSVNSTNSSFVEPSDAQNQSGNENDILQDRQNASEDVSSNSVVSVRRTRVRRKIGVEPIERPRRSTRSSAFAASVDYVEPDEISDLFPMEASEGPADASTVDDTNETGQVLQESDEEEEEDNSAVFPGMDLEQIPAKPMAFQVQPDLEDLPYLDTEAEMKRMIWQATKVRLEMERQEVHVKITDSQCVMIDNQKRWQCNICPKNYTTKHNLVTHILDHNGIKPHLCMVCGKSFKQLSHLNTHMLTHDNIKPHVCPICGKGFTQVSHLKRHQTVHLDNKPNICDICNRGFAYPSELRVHKEKHIPGRDKCVDCGEDFASPRLLKQHQATHEHREELTCSQCDRVFRYPSQLRDHVITHSGTRPFICTECGMDFMKEHHLKAHMFTHTGLRPYSCQECGRAFNQKANLQRHLLIHSSERAYKCEQCDKTFTQPQTLKAHMVVHADKKPYWCNLCGKEFGRLHNLQGHMHMHNNSKPYVCFCGSSFTLKGNLNRHKKVKHGLNESTESMEEEAVNFLSLMSERTREEKSVDDEDLEGEGHDPSAASESGDQSGDSPPLDPSIDPKSHRRERKSTPRKIPRQRKSVENEDLSSQDAGEDDPETVSQYFDNGNKQDGESSQEGQTTKGRKTRRGQRSDSQEVKVKVEKDVGSENDEELSPNSKRACLRQGNNLDNIIAKKFQS